MALSEIRVNTTKTRTGVGTITYTETGPVITGIATASNFKTGSTNVHSTGVELTNINTGGATATFGGPISGTTASFSGTVSIGGTLTYEDVTNIDAVGLITARSGIKVTGGNVELAQGAGTGYYQVTQTSGNTVKFGIVSGSDVEISGSSNNNIIIKRAGTARLTVTSDGATVTDNLTANAVISSYGGIVNKLGFISGGAEGYTGTTSNHSLFLGTAGSNRIKIANNSAATSIGGAFTFNAMLTTQGDISGGLLMIKAAENTNRLFVTGNDSSGVEVNLYDAGGGQKGILGVSGSEFFIKAPNNSAPLKLYTHNGSSVGERLQIDHEGLKLKNLDTGGGISINALNSTSNYGLVVADANRPNENDLILGIGGSWAGDSVAQIDFRTGADTTNKDDGKIMFYTQATNAGGLVERLRIKSDGGMRLQKNDGNANFTISRNASVTSNDATVGVIDFANNTQHTVNSRIMGKTAGTSNVGGDLVVETRADGGSLTEKFRITGAGRVGVGEADPDHIFHIKGSTPILAVESSSWASGVSAALRLSYTAGDAREIRGHYEKGLIFTLNQGEAMRIHTSNKVGINQGGTYNPLTSLDVRHPLGTSGTGTLQSLVTICAGRNSNRGLEIKTGHPTTGNQNDAGVYYNAKDTESGSYSAQHVWQMGGGNAMVLGYTGKYHLGIGENYPAYPLDISYTDNNAWQNGSIGNGVEIHNKSTTAGTFAGLHLYATGNGANAAASHISCVHTANGTGDMSFANRHGAGGHTERMRLHSDGILKVYQGVDAQTNVSAGFYSPVSTGYVGTQWTEQGAAFVFYMGELVSGSSSNASSNYVNCYTSHHWGDYPRLIIWAHERYYRCSSTCWTFGCYGGSSRSHSLVQTESWGGTNGSHGTDNAGSVSVNHAGHVATYSSSQVHRYELTMSNTGNYGYTRWYIGVLKPGARGLYSSAASTSTVDSSSSSGGCTHFKTMSQAQFGPITYLG